MTSTVVFPGQLSDALTSTLIHAGDTLRLRTGTHTLADITATMFDGTPAHPITVEPYGDGPVILDGALFVSNSNVTFKNIEFRDTRWTTRQGSNDYTDSRVLAGTGSSAISPVYLSGSRVALINCIVHDGFNVYAACPGMTFYGCLVYNNGLKQLNGAGNGHGLYSHTANPSATPALLDTNIWMADYNYGLHINSDNAANQCEYYTAQNNIVGKCNGKHIFGSGAGPSKGLIWSNNCTWDTYICFNYSTGVDSEDITVTDNYFVGGTAARLGAAWWKVFKTITHRRNTYIARGTPELLRVKYPPVAAYTYDWDDNDYYTIDTHLAFEADNRPEFDGLYHNLADWKTLTGLDATSREYQDTTPPDRTFLYPNSYDAGRAHLAIYNWSGADTVSVDVSSVFATDDVVRCHNAQDYFVDYDDLTVAGDGTIDIDMLAASHSVAIPYQDTVVIDPTTFPTFGAFVLEKT